MEQEVLKIKKVRPNAVIPQRATERSAGLDLTACIEAPLTVKAGERILIPTGIAIALPAQSVGLIFARSSLGTKHGIALSNGVGVIDEDYRGEVHVGIFNSSAQDYTVQPFERIAQLVVMPVCYPVVEASDTLDDTARGSGGFGSTGRM